MIELFVAILGVILMAVFGYGTYWGNQATLLSIQKKFGWETHDPHFVATLYNWGAGLFLIGYTVFYFFKTIYLILVLTRGVQIASFSPAGTTLALIEPLLEVWPIGDILALLNTVFISLFWKAYGAVSFAHGFWKKGLRGYLLQLEFPPLPTARDRMLAVLVCLFALLVLIAIPDWVGFDPTIGRFPELIFAGAVLAGVYMRRYVEFYNKDRWGYY
ncbi:MAG: hypothetical protein ACE5R6_20090 [Candidatus Heimdallarchaeota archaeon]